MIAVNCAVEGDLDEVVARRLLGHVGLGCGPVFGREGKQTLRKGVNGYTSAARFHPWFLLVDLDDDEPCAGALVAGWAPAIPPLMRFRVAVKEIEAWLLADRSGFARFLSVSRDLIPRNPDSIADPKALVVETARRSGKRAVRDGLPPRVGSGRAVGPLYVSDLATFVRELWSIDDALASSDSLARCVRALSSLQGALKERASS